MLIKVRYDVETMAKLSAHGRVEIVRMQRENNAPKSDFIVWEKVTIAMMSDGKMLEKRDVRFKPTEFGRSDKHTYGWKVKGKLKSDMTRDRFIQVYTKAGFQVV